MSNNTLTGQIPFQIGALSQLFVLDLSTNFYLRGRIPSSITNCSLLRQLVLHTTLIGGEIPPAIGRLSYLERIRMKDTLINGTVPRSLGNCSSLRVLVLGNTYLLTYLINSPKPPENVRFDLTNTQLTGTLPKEMANLKILREIYLQGTKIYGPIPSWIANRTLLHTFVLADSFLSGQIPAVLGSLSLLTVVDLSGNNFSSVIPRTISNCSNLEYLAIASSNLEGTIPSDIGLLTELDTLYLDTNQLVGEIPASLSNCSSMVELALGENFDMIPQPLPTWIGFLANLETLSFPSMQLVGNLPLEIAELPNLSYLDVEENHLHGSIPKHLGNCSTLETLSLGGNKFSGKIPPELWELRQLIDLEIWGNNLTGSLSDAIGNLSYLKAFYCNSTMLNGAIPSRLSELSSFSTGYFQNSQFHGQVPDTIGNMSGLQTLDLSFNRISGRIPTSLRNMSALITLVIGDNQLTGRIPVALMSCTQLTYLDLHGNGLVGSIPEEIGQLQDLTQLFLQSNNLSGALPGSFGRCSSLVTVDISYNVFQGVLPGEAFGNASSALSSLNVSRNFFSGGLPRSFGVFTEVTTLQFSKNNFSGSIPPELGSCLSLAALDLSENNFSGTIPQTLASLKHLEFLNLSFNDLGGPLPESGIFSSDNFSAEWFLGNPKLCGSRLGKNCSTSTESFKCRGLSCKAARLAMIISLVTSALLVVAAGISVLLWIRRAQRRNKVQEGVITFDRGVYISEQDILTVTDNPNKLIGTGASSSVYRVDLSDGKVIALKVLIVSRSSNSAGDDFHDKELNKAKSSMYREANTLSKLKHRNILKILGMVSSGRMTGLMLEFMPMGSLDNPLHRVEDGFLGWEQRFDVALGIAQGVVYLHEEVEVPIIHTDLKPKNILLDPNMIPKLGDFGISRFISVRAGDGEVTATQVCGTYGYIPPEYASNIRVSTRGDVFSYGVILLELVTRRRPNTSEQSGAPTSSQGQKHSNPLVDWVLQNSMGPQPWTAVVDPLLLREDNGNSTLSREKQMQPVKLLIQVGLLCTQINPQSRPRMYDVLAMLTHIQRLGEDPAKVPTLAELAADTTELPSIELSSTAYQEHPTPSI